MVSVLTQHPVRAVVAGAFLLVGLTQYFAEPWLRRVERIAARVSLRKRAVIVGAGLFAIAARLLLLPLEPVPIPWVHDEFSYLLAGDTFAHGRLTNPPVPDQVALFLDTFHVLQHPTYASKYPPAQGMALAVGQLLGNPWIGVLLSIAAMCSAVAWALQGWLPARWALLGTLLVLLRMDVMNYWVDGYWGGAVAAIGGALVIGAHPRMLRRFRIRDSVLMGIGAALLANSRPVEGLLFCVPVVAFLAFRWWRGNRGFRLRLAKALLPAALVIGCTVAFIGYYNWRITGSAVVFPRAYYDRLYFNFPVFLWQKAPAPLSYRNPQFTGFFVGWCRTEFLGRSVRALTYKKFLDSWRFFLGPVLSIPLLTLPWLAFDRRIRFLLVQGLWCWVWMLVVIWFEPHYMAPLVVTIFAVVTQGMRHLRQWRVGGYRIGILASRMIIVLVIAEIFLPGAEKASSQDLAPLRSWNLARAKIAEELQATPEKNLVIVHYDPNHEAHYEWVYNAADIESAKVVWAREIPGVDLKPLLDYFRDRKVWVVNADAAHPQVEPYHGDATAWSSK